MVSLRDKKLLLALGTILLIVPLTYLAFSYAGPTSTQSHLLGWAFSDNIGWVSFSGNNYGFEISDDGKIEGYAWSDNIGWISFMEEDLSGCPEPPCLAEVEFTQYSDDFIGCPDNICRLSGWARALSGMEEEDGFDGWISLDEGYFKREEGEKKNISGWFWGDKVIGWIQLGDDSGEYHFSDSLRTAYNFPPERAYDLEVKMGSEELCGSGEDFTPSFEWSHSDLEGDPARYTIDFITPSNIEEIDVGRWTYPGEESVSLNFGSGFWDTDFEWYLLGEDDKERVVESDSHQFTSPKHHYPIVSFKWFPEEPVVGEIIEFDATSTVLGGGQTLDQADWIWEFETEADYEVSGDDTPTPSLLISKESIGDSIEVRLTVDDREGYRCSSQWKTISESLGYPFPEWEEVDL